MGRLRTSLWRLRRTGQRLLDVTSSEVALDPEVAVDVRELTELTHRLPDVPPADDKAALELLTEAGELLPDWDEDWLVADRERIRQLRLYALEELGEQLASEGRFGSAVDALLMAIAEDPLRESARRTLIRIHVAEGNVHDAVTQYRAYRDVVRDDLGLEPSPQMAALLVELGIDGAAGVPGEALVTGG
jgi:DNA-binding SARP family transcriptional activator